jgi:hypothetical protein
VTSAVRTIKIIRDIRAIGRDHFRDSIPTIDRERSTGVT